MRTDLTYLESVELLAGSMTHIFGTGAAGKTTLELVAALCDLGAAVESAFEATSHDNGSTTYRLTADPSKLREVLMMHRRRPERITTTLPCPPWCEEGHGHALTPTTTETDVLLGDAVPGPSALTRTHHASYGFDLEAGEDLVTVDLEEYADHAEGPAFPPIDPPLIWISDGGRVDMHKGSTPAQARALAAALLEAANALERASLT